MSVSNDLAIDGNAGRYISMLNGANADKPPNIKRMEYFCFVVIKLEGIICVAKVSLENWIKSIYILNNS